MNQITTIAETIPFKPADLKQINKARAEAAAINAVIGKCLGDPPHAPRHEFFSWLHLQVDRCEAELVENPTHESAEKFHAAVMRFKQAEQSQERIGGALQLALQKVSQTLSGIVNSLLDATRKKIIAEADKRRAELATSNHALFSNEEEKRTLEARVQSLIHELNAQREEAGKCPLSWLDRHGLAMDDITAPQAEDAA
jgi:hypothetical protein